MSDASAVAAQQTLVIAMAPIGVPAQVDQPQWLVRLADGSLASLEQERWASPLGGELRQALVERLALRHGIVEAQVAETPPTARVVINLLRFDSTPGREALVEGSWLIQPQPGSSDATASRCSWTFSPAGRRRLRCARRSASANRDPSRGFNRCGVARSTLDTLPGD